MKDAKIELKNLRRQQVAVGEGSWQSAAGGAPCGRHCPWPSHQGWRRPQSLVVQGPLLRPPHQGCTIKLQVQAVFFVRLWAAALEDMCAKGWRGVLHGVLQHTLQHPSRMLMSTCWKTSASYNALSRLQGWRAWACGNKQHACRRALFRVLVGWAPEYALA